MTRLSLALQFFTGKCFKALTHSLFKEKWRSGEIWLASPERLHAS